MLKPGGRVFLWSINRSQQFTWNWVLAKLGVDVFERVAHEPARLPDPVTVVDQLDAAGLSVESLDYFNAFFTLALDEAIMIVIEFMKRLGMKCRKVGYVPGRAANPDRIGCPGR